MVETKTDDKDLSRGIGDDGINGHNAESVEAFLTEGLTEHRASNHLDSEEFEQYVEAVI